MRKLIGSAMGVIVGIALTVEVEARERGFYIGASAGYSEYDVEKSDGFLIGIVGAGLGGFGVQVYPDEQDVDDGELGYGATLGYRVNSWLAAEVGYTMFGDAEVSETYDTNFPSVPTFPPQITRTHTSEIRGPAMSLLVMLPLGQFDLFARAGVLFADHTIDLGPRSSPREQTFGDEVILGGVGVDWSFSTRWAARLEYQRTGALSKTFTSGEVELEHAAASVLFRF